MGRSSRNLPQVAEQPGQLACCTTFRACHIPAPAPHSHSLNSPLSGAAGFIGSRIAARLLACGHTVHATRRAAGDDEAMAAALSALPGADQRLHWFHADLMQDGSYDAAMQGCR